jgi:hypothetical protein
MRKSLTRTLAGVVLAAATVLALAGPASAAPAQPRVHTTLSIVQSRNVIKPGHKDVISGRLVADRHGLPHKIVLLDRWIHHRWVPVRAGLTGPHGWVSFAVWPRVTARYVLVYLGNRVFAPTHSGVVTVRVVQ